MQKVYKSEAAFGRLYHIVAATRI